ncbi:exonuclease SbcCD subunit D [Vibrio sp. CAU 1672]|uniref:exonuclease SbcCD subunit D n=1 Tax=Vibrio sp. CAU 1672 TaxID=3032594 RepID=UPI0023DA12AD|nr:exonuclease SbcCD subunit D [Vibrio sp. CAU 1672]MDF2153466.1 exonuclease SbcCD subunit D [Vibrio sp. CAU 1672]
MKFIHTSDWHLGRQFHNVSLIDDQKAVLEQMVEYIRNHPVDAVVIAGDIYDRSVPPTVAIELLNQVVNQICGELNTPMIVIPGNHDGAERLGFGSEQMKLSGLHIISNFADMLEPVVIKSKSAGNVALYGMPYSDPEVVRFAFQAKVATHDEAHQLLVEKIRQQCQPADKNVLISHCFVDGAIESESERPLSIGGSDRVSHEHFVDFDYVALGHLHQPQQKGTEYIRYSGSLMKYSFGEQHHKKGFTLVELDADGFVSAENVELIAPHEMRIVEGELEQIIEQGKTDPKNEDYLLVRLMDKHAILNPMEKLRSVYPNVLHLEKPGMLIGVEQEMAQAKLARSEMDMFRDFFLEAQDSELSEQQDQAISAIIKQLSQQ